MTLVDSNVILDVVTDGEAWADWSQEQLEQAASAGPLVINDVIYAEISTRYSTVEDVDAMLRNLDINVATIPRARSFWRARPICDTAQRAAFARAYCPIFLSALTPLSSSGRS